MKKYVAKRVITAIFTLLVILLVLFILMQLMPGSPFNDEKLTADLHEEKLCFILMDVDKFKSVNDTYGHDQGDLVLRKVAEVLKHQFRSGDMIFRLGGDEFAVIMVNTGTELQDLVRRKIMTANEELNRGEGIPPV